MRAGGAGDGGADGDRDAQERGTELGGARANSAWRRATFLRLCERGVAALGGVGEDLRNASII
jgi:hypothetical protein